MKTPKNDARSGHPSTWCEGESIEHVHFFVLSDRSMTVRMIAETVGLRTSSVHNIWTENAERKNLWHQDGAATADS